MKYWLARVPTWLVLLGLGTIAVFAHTPLYQVGFEFLDSDDATVPIVTTLFRQGNWSPFYLQQAYGGTVLTAIRTAWVSAYEALIHGDFNHLWSQLSFTFGVIPVLLAWAVYFIVRAYCSRATALIVGMVGALGLQFWTVELLERDFYVAYILLGFILLALRARLDDPLRTLSLRGLFWLGALSGFALYTCRAAVIFVIAFFLRESDIPHFFKRFWHSPKIFDRILSRAFALLVGLFAYLAFFGTTLGTLGGRRVLTDAFPNLQIAGVLLLIYCAREFLSAQREWKKRLTILGAGAALGMAPEIGYWVAHLKLSPALAHGAAYWDQTAAALGAFPLRIFEMVAAGNHLARNASVLLFVAALVAFMRAARANPKLSPIRFTAVLSLIAFFSVNQTAVGVLRYLLPLSPVLFVMLGVLIDRLRFRTLTEKAAALTVGALLVLHGWHQLSGRAEYVSAHAAQPQLTRAKEIISAFRDNKVNLVIADDYWESNQYTFLSQWRPLFISNGRELGVKEGFELKRTENRVGLILTTATPSGPDLRELDFNGARWRVSFLRQVQGRSLFIGEKISPN